MLIPPADVQIYQTPLSIVWIDKTGIVCAVSNGAEPTMENYKKVMELYSKLMRGPDRLRILFESSNTRPVSEEVKAYLAVELPKYIRALAFVSKSTGGKVMASVFNLVTPQPYQSLLFNNIEEAKEWLSSM